MFVSGLTSAGKDTGKPCADRVWFTVYNAVSETRPPPSAQLCASSRWRPLSTFAIVPIYTTSTARPDCIVAPKDCPINYKEGEMVMAAIKEFPEDLFTNNERKSGAVLLHIAAALYMFLALAIICDDYFVTSLEKICEKLDLSEDVAGATFMAAGSSAPELFASVIGVFITHGDVGVGTIVGSAVFNILCIIGVCGIFAGQFIYDEKVVWWESLVLVLMYCGYILIMKFNQSLQKLFTGKGGKDKNQANGNAAASSEMEDGKTACYGDDDPSLPILSTAAVKPSKAYSRGSVVMVDEIMHDSPPKLRFPEAGLRVMVTSHFGPKTRLRMASRLIITEGANGVETQVLEGKVDIENGNVPEDKPAVEEQENETISPFHIPGPRWEKFFMISFFLSTVWIAVFSYFMVWMVTIIGYTLGIPDVIMGITFLAAGTSVPDCIASLIVGGIHVNHWKLDLKLGIYTLVLYAVFLCFSIMIEYNVFTFVNLPMVGQ
ncbi:unnamed protein product [Coregonus sp. 'balchen']|nr:unnamed protein product [Coregonus sp. 'balchen']